MSYAENTDNLLLGLAWFGEASVIDIQKLWFPSLSVWGVRKRLKDLRQEGYITERRWGISHEKGLPPIQQPSMWSLTRHALDRLKDDDLFPPKYLPPRARLSLPHDSKTSELITRIIELARESRIFCGMYIEREVRLDPAKRRPIMDALIAITVGEAFTGEYLVPWSRNPKLDHERRARFAIENDRSTEALHVLADKAHSYRNVGTKRWQEIHGAFPVVMFLVPNERRLNAIMSHWRDVWPRGKWIMTTDDWLRGDYWVQYDDGEETIRGLFRNEPRLPPAQPLRRTVAEAAYGDRLQLLTSTNTPSSTVYQRVQLPGVMETHAALLNTATWKLEVVDLDHPMCLVPEQSHQ